eukprot:3281461-Amphidinium_carterae.1
MLLKGDRGVADNASQAGQAVQPTVQGHQEVNALVLGLVDTEPSCQFEAEPQPSSASGAVWHPNVCARSSLRKRDSSEEMSELIQGSCVLVALGRWHLDSMRLAQQGGRWHTSCHQPQRFAVAQSSQAR